MSAAFPTDLSAEARRAKADHGHAFLLENLALMLSDKSFKCAGHYKVLRIYGSEILATNLLVFLMEK